MARFWEESGKAMSAYMRPREGGARPPNGADEAVDVVKTLGQVAERWMAEPARAAEAQRAFASGFLELWAGSLKRFSGEPAEPIVRPDPKDARFKDPEWTEHPVFDFLKQAYLHTSRWAERMVDEAHELDPHTRHKASFYVKLIANAVSPSNFVPTNPELIRETLATKGENLVRGMRMLAEDIDAGKGDLRIRQTDPTGFEVGRNLATTPGKVVFRNELFELIQYAPATEMARTRPVVIVPPWINKFYILDLTPEKSLIKWCVEQGLTVFCVSWVNPDERHATKSFDDYMRDGIMRAIDVASEICGTKQVDMAGYCVGGTLLSITMAYMAATGDDRIASATLLTAQVDFTHAGDLRVFVDEDQIAAVEARMAEAGYLEGGRMANAFNMLRSNDLIWPYVVNSYLKGRAPFPFDLLYWNSDATRMPAANHSFYLRRCYLKNDLARGKMEILGVTLNLKQVKTPIYSVATREDHIAPAKSVFLGSQLFGGPVRFVLAGSGHIAGVVNPPARMKYQHWTGEAPTGDLNDWIAAAEEKPGSWWPDWRAWLAAADATMVVARVPGAGPYPAIEDAPGSYVKMKA
ncbi:MAG TPA: class I poly(R)-hydroxyalkanoic acid synthase [Hansschlegelia sp.]